MQRHGCEHRVGQTLGGKRTRGNHDMVFETRENSKMRAKEQEVLGGSVTKGSRMNDVAVGELFTRHL